MVLTCVILATALKLSTIRYLPGLIMTWLTMIMTGITRLITRHKEINILILQLRLVSQDRTITYTLQALKNLEMEIMTLLSLILTVCWMQKNLQYTNMPLWLRL